MGRLARAAKSLASSVRNLWASDSPLAPRTNEEWLRAVALIRHEEAAKARLEHQYDPAREQWAGIQQRQVGVKLRWTPADVERIVGACHNGDLWPLALFTDSLFQNAVVFGAMSARTTFLRLQAQWTGDPTLIRWLDGELPKFDEATGLLISEGHRSDFQRLFPLPELQSIVAMGDLCGLGLGEFCPDRNGVIRLQRLDMHWVRMDVATDSLWYQSPSGASWEIRPGDGRWFAYAPYGLRRFWARAPWFPCALPAISMMQTTLDQLRYIGFHADPLKLIKLDKDRIDQDGAAMERFARDDWRRAAYLVLRTDEEAALVEASGQGHEVYTSSDKSAADKINLALRGQLATAGDGGGGLASKGSIWGAVEAGIIGQSAKMTEDAIQEQGLRPYAIARNRKPLVWLHWDTRTSDQKVADAEALEKNASALTAITAALKPYGKGVVIAAYLESTATGVQTVDLPGQTAPSRQIELAPTSLDAVITVDQALQNEGFPPVGPPKGNLTIAERKQEILGPGGAANDATASAWGSGDFLDIPVYEQRRIAGMDIVIDRPRGTLQSGIGPDGAWTREFQVDNGFIEGTLAPDGEGIDVYVGAWPGAPNAYVVEQLRRDGTFDEFKVLLDFLALDVAVGAYLLHVPPWCLGYVHTVPATDALAFVEAAQREKLLPPDEPVAAE